MMASLYGNPAMDARPVLCRLLKIDATGAQTGRTRVCFFQASRYDSQPKSNHRTG